MKIINGLIRRVVWTCVIAMLDDAVWNAEYRFLCGNEERRMRAVIKLEYSLWLLNISTLFHTKAENLVSTVSQFERGSKL